MAKRKFQIGDKVTVKSNGIEGEVIGFYPPYYRVKPITKDYWIEKRAEQLEFTKAKSTQTTEVPESKFEIGDKVELKKTNHGHGIVSDIGWEDDIRGVAGKIFIIRNKMFIPKYNKYFYAKPNSTIWYSEDGMTLITKGKQATKPTTKPNIVGERPQPIYITCSDKNKHIMKAMYETLIDMGYTKSNTCHIDDLDYRVITHNWSAKDPSDFKKYKEVWSTHDSSYTPKPDSYHIKFTLPQDWDKVVEYCKHWINEKNWEGLKPKEKTLVLGSKSDSITVHADGVIIIRATGGHSVDYTIQEVTKLFDTFNSPSKLMKGYSARLSEDVRCILIGCTQENHLFSLKELQTIIDTHKSLTSR